jgi:hypothetical protein
MASVVPPQTVRFELEGGRVLREEVCPLVGQLPVPHLCLSGCFIGIFEWTTLCRTWGANRALRRLTLRRTNLDADAAKEVCQLLAHNRRLLSLDLSSNRLGDVGARAVADGLAANRRIQSLDLRQNHLTTAGGRALLSAGLQAVRANGALRLLSAIPLMELADDSLPRPSLELSGMRLGCAEAAILCGLLPLAPGVAHLRLRDNLLDANAADLLGIELARPGCALRSLDCSDNALTDAGARLLARVRHVSIPNLAVELERIALEDEYFVSRNLYPNVDFYSGIIYQAMGFPTSMFPVLFAMGRIPGWLAHWQENLLDSEQAIVRPRQLFVGADERAYPAPGDR